MKRRPVSAMLLSVLILGPAALRAADRPSPALIADLNHLPVQSGGFDPFYEELPRMRPVESGGILYFEASDPAHNGELWRSDGTAAGTWRVADVNPGPGSSSPRSLTAHKGRIWFTATDGVRGIEFWSSDGTSRGTLPLGDLCPGPCDSASFGFSNLVSAGDHLFFNADGTGSRDRIWVTDGTRAGTVELATPGLYSTLRASLPGGRALFTLQEAPPLSPSGAVLWISDGTQAGTVRLTASTGGQIVEPASFNRLGDVALFWVGTSLWRTDGTAAGTWLVREGIVGPAAPALVLNGIAYFANIAGEVWATDGTAQGTARLAGGFSRDAGYTPSQLTASACGPLFLAGTETRQLQIWRVPPSGPVEAISPALPSVVGPWSAGDRAFFAVADYAAQTSELWTVDSVSCRPARVASLCGAGRPCATGSLLPYRPAAAGRTALFVLNTAAEGAELWRSDGTEAGTFQVRDIGFDPGSGAGPLASLGGQALFSARTGAGPAGLWRTDGTAAGTRAFKFVPWPQGFVNAGSSLYFTAGAPGACANYLAPCRGLWKTDGTRAGTRQVNTGSFYVDSLGVGGGRLLFSAVDDPSFLHGTGNEPWISDGTPAGTGQVYDINQQLYSLPITSPVFVGSSDPGPAVWTGSRFLFAADDGLHGRELWSTDGTATGTLFLADINHQTAGPQPSDSNPDFFAPLGSSFLFAADDGVNGRELWATDGTAPGTRLVRDLRPGAEGSSPHDLVALNGKVWFLAGDVSGHQALWSSDGTADGTRAMASLGNAVTARSLTAVGNRLFFVVDGEARGTELWTSDGTTAGTRLARDIRPGRGGSYPRSLTAIDGLLVFAADDGTTGLEPWVSDGTAAGTRRLGDLAPGTDASSPGPFVVAGSYVVFTAWDPVHGRELWSVPRAGLK